MTPLDALRSAVASCPAARGHVPDDLTAEGIANRLRTYDIDPKNATARNVSAICAMARNTWNGFGAIFDRTNQT